MGAAPARAADRLCLIAYVLLNMALPAKIAAIAWLCVGIGALIGLKLMGKRATLPA